MNTPYSFYHTSNNHVFRVPLPIRKREVFLRKSLAFTLIRIYEAGEQGISTLDLLDHGMISVASYVAELRALGAVIHKQMRYATHWRVGTRHYVAHYSYGGWNGY
jgi:hypothetical protein